MTDIPGILALSIPIVAIIVAGAVTLVRMVIRHRERLAMIEAGMHPDYPPLDQEEGAVRVSEAPRVEPPPLRSVSSPPPSRTMSEK